MRSLACEPRHVGSRTVRRGVLQSGGGDHGAPQGLEEDAAVQGAVQIVRGRGGSPELRAWGFGRGV